jgi:hypothetical protein
MPPTGPSFGNKEASASTSFLSTGKKDENRRTLTDFKIVGLSIPELDWTWGIVPHSASTVQVKEEPKDSDTSPSLKDEPVDDKSALHLEDAKESQSDTKPDISGKSADAADGEKNASSESKAPPATLDQPASSRYPPDSNGTNPPPSRMRIYFHTPVTADDSRPIPHTVSPSYEANRKGKRKKLEDDDGDLEEGRAPPPPPQMSALNEDRASVAASATTDTVSEDWLMAAIVEGEGDAGTHEGDADDDAVETQVVEDLHDDDLDAEGEVETLMDGERLFHLDCDDEPCKGVKARLIYAHFLTCPFLCIKATISMMMTSTWVEVAHCLREGSLLWRPILKFRLPSLLSQPNHMMAYPQALLLGMDILLVKVLLLIPKTERRPLLHQPIMLWTILTQSLRLFSMFLPLLTLCPYPIDFQPNPPLTLVVF